MITESHFGIQGDKKVHVGKTLAILVFYLQLYHIHFLRKDKSKFKNEALPKEMSLLDPKSCITLKNKFPDLIGVL